MICRRILTFAVCLSALFFTLGADSWKAPDPVLSDAIRLEGIWGSAQADNARRLGESPLDKVDFILDDLTLKQHRRFAEYSGDISGRWIGAAAFLMPRYPKPFAAFSEVMSQIPTLQKGDGHFGVDQDLEKLVRTRDMPILWGNGRILLGLVEVFERTGSQTALDAAKKLGDYFLATDPVFNRAENFQGVGGDLADGFGTCYFSCIEGLVALARVTENQRYLEQAKRIGALALTVDHFDGLHSHGRLCAVRGFADLYAATGEHRWLEGAERDWKNFMQRWRMPTAGIKEVLADSYLMDEGCSESDWLRLSLSLWRLTGKAAYLDEAERCLKGHFIYQQFPTGGAGHRNMYLLENQPVAFHNMVAEAWWCCSMHWARALVDVARFAVGSDEEGLWVNLGVDCSGTVPGPGGDWKVAVTEAADGLHVCLGSPVATKTVVRIHRPSWAAEKVCIEAPSDLSIRETKDTWFVEGTWNGDREIVAHLPTALRSEPTGADSGVLLRGYDLLAAHRSPANAWLVAPMATVRPVVLWAAALPSEDGRIVVPASLEKDPDPNRPEQWKRLELAPLRAMTGQPHETAWFSFRLRSAPVEQIHSLSEKLR
jgi:DUF1680 family protein